MTTTILDKMKNCKKLVQEYKSKIAVVNQSKKLPQQNMLLFKYAVEDQLYPGLPAQIRGK